MKKTTLLCILDGFGLNPNPKANAVHLAKKPHFDRLWAKCPHATLTTFGERVGLPAGQMGNSEVGHLNIGAGRVVEQWLLRISRALAGDFLFQSKAYQKLAAKFDSMSALHLAGLYSAGGVHSHAEHLKLLISRVSKDYSGDVYLHLFTDGRDTAPRCAGAQVADLCDFLKAFPKCKIATVCGRFFAMDRDKRWERTKKAYDAMFLMDGLRRSDPVAALNESYGNEVSDEFVEPIIAAPVKINPRDGIIFWNFREDRMRQIVAALCLKEFTGFERAAPPFDEERVLCFTEYDHSFKLPFLFPTLEIRNHLGEYLSNLGMKQLRVAETEKYPHVTYFFNGGNETPYAGEDRKLIPSPRDVKTYDLKPEMSAVQVTDVVVEAIEHGSYDFVVVNLANCDMVGHTGVLDAAVRAVETVDICLGRMVAALEKHSGRAVIIADHGNAEQMIDYKTGVPFTSHTTYPVPIIVLGAAKSSTLIEDGALCDVAPTLLKLMGLEQPTEMSGRSLIEHL